MKSVLTATLATTEFASKFLTVERHIAKERGDFLLFALVLPVEADQWDLLVAAEWAKQDELGTVRYITKQIISLFGVGILRELSRIIVLNAEDPKFQTFVAALNIVGVIVPLRDFWLFDVQVKEAYIITARHVGE